MAANIPCQAGVSVGCHEWRQCGAESLWLIQWPGPRTFRHFKPACDNHVAKGLAAAVFRQMREGESGCDGLWLWDVECEYQVVIGFWGPMKGMG